MKPIIISPPDQQNTNASAPGVLSISRSSSTSSDSALASPKECFPHDIYEIVEENEEDFQFDADDEDTDDTTSVLSIF